MVLLALTIIPVLFRRFKKSANMVSGETVDVCLWNIKTGLRRQGGGFRRQKDGEPFAGAGLRASIDGFAGNNLAQQQAMVVVVEPLFCSAGSAEDA